MPAPPRAELVGDPRDLLVARGLRKSFALGAGMIAGGSIRAVDGVSLEIRRGETLAVVGESGCGKSTLSRLLMGLLDADDGDIVFDGEGLGSRDLPLQRYRRNVQMVFQDSHASLNPRLTIADTIAFAPRVQGMRKAEARDRAHEMLEAVGLAPRQFAHRFPHELSGGQRQRVNIARALAPRPRLLVLDEPVSALDTSVRAQVLNLLLELKRRFGLTYLFISHDLGVVEHVADRVLVMYLGRVVEIGPAAAIFAAAAHPYAKALVDSRPTIDPANRRKEPPLTGDPPDLANLPSGCSFRTRCAIAEPGCADRQPSLATIAPAHAVACFVAVREAPS